MNGYARLRRHGTRRTRQGRAGIAAVTSGASRNGPPRPRHDTLLVRHPLAGFTLVARKRSARHACPAGASRYHHRRETGHRQPSMSPFIGFSPFRSVRPRNRSAGHRVHQHRHDARQHQPPNASVHALPTLSLCFRSLESHAAARQPAVARRKPTHLQTLMATPPLRDPSARYRPPWPFSPRGFADTRNQTDGPVA